MSRVQLALNVSDVDAAVDFYTRLFAIGPAKRRPGYANFVIAEPALKLVLVESSDAALRGAGVRGALNHLGIEVESPADVVSHVTRLSAEGLATEVEDATTCCYAVQDKVWVHDPDGAPWEIYTVLADAPSDAPVTGCGPGGMQLLTFELRRRLLAELLGSGMLTAIVVGSGIAAQRLSPTDVGLQLLENAVATTLGLYVLILTLGPVSGAHFNPVVSVVDAVFGGIRWPTAAAYLPVQFAGCAGGAVVANLMFSDGVVTVSTHHRASGAHLLSEMVATAGLIVVVFALASSGRSGAAPAAVGAYIGAAYFFTSSTSFANPAITVGRMLSNTFAGIAPTSGPAFVGAQIVGGAVGYGVIRVLYPSHERDARRRG